MNVAFRVFLALLAAITAYSLMSVALMLILPANSLVPLIFWSLLCVSRAFWAGRLVWRRPESSSGSAMLGRSVAIGALLVGGIGIFAGFLGQ